MTSPGVITGFTNLVSTSAGSKLGRMTSVIMLILSRERKLVEIQDVCESLIQNTSAITLLGWVEFQSTGKNNVQSSAMTSPGVITGFTNLVSTSAGSKLGRMTSVIMLILSRERKLVEIQVLLLLLVKQSWCEDFTAHLILIITSPRPSQNTRK